MAASASEHIDPPAASSLYKTVGARLREARRAAKLTQEELASRVSLTRTSVTNIEKGRQKVLLHTLVELAKAVQVPVYDLIPDMHTQDAEAIEYNLVSDDLSDAERDWIVSELLRSANK